MIERDRPVDIEGLKIETLDAEGVREAVEVIARGMRDNPQHVAAFGEEPGNRERKLRRLFGAAVGTLEFGRHMLVARGPDGSIVGVCGMAPPGTCQPGLGRQLQLMPALLALGPRSTGRAMKWMGAWAKQDPDAPHWHLGPVAVDTHLQGMGIGSKLMQEFSARMDAAGEDAYLETDKEINVRFYERFGFGVIGEQQVLGVPNWFMLRHPSRNP